MVLFAPQGDLSSSASIEILQAQLPKSKLAVLHLAGLLQDALLSRLGRAELEKVFGPKVDGLKNLKEVASLEW